jgi:Ni/Co efflux regulator RcnB
MTLKQLLISASAVAWLAWPAATMAAPPSDHGDRPDQQGPQSDYMPAAHGGGAAAARRAAPVARTPQIRHSSGGDQPRAHVGPTGPVAQPVVHAARTTPSAPRGPVHPRPDRTVDRPPVLVPTAPAALQAQFGPAWRPVGKTAQPPKGVARLGDWNRTVRGPDRDQAGVQWRQGHANWDSRSPWRSNPNWWRGDRSFRLFLGPRIGFFFVPDFGYVRPPAQYERRYWRTGEFLPNWFWRYEVREYWRLDLPRPPDGCIWVWVDNDVALIDASDGYILDIVHNAW